MILVFGQISITFLPPVFASPCSLWATAISVIIVIVSVVVIAIIIVSIVIVIVTFRLLPSSLVVSPCSLEATARESLEPDSCPESPLVRELE